MRPHLAVFFAASAVFACGIGVGQSASAQVPAPVASPAASPSPSPKPTKKPSRLTLGISSYTTGVDQQFVGPGSVPPAPLAASFAAGGALAPGTPYDYFSGAPTTTGAGIHFEINVQPTYALSTAVDATVQFGYGSIGGSGNVAGYWGESTMPTINPHLGSQAATLTPAFNTHNGQDAVTAARGSVLKGSIAMHNGSGEFNVGWFNLHQTAPFVFQQAPWTNTPVQLVPQMAHSLSNGSPSDDVFVEGATVLPLHGADIWKKVGDTTVEFASADLPAAVTSPARLFTGSVVIDHGSGLKYSAQFAHVNESGPDTARVLFGNSPSLTSSLNGLIPQSTVYGQHVLIAGAGATFQTGEFDAEARYGYSCYGANGVAVSSSSCTSGNYYYGKIHHGFSHFDLALEVVRFEPTYAPALLSYGTLENVWTAPYAYPGNWLNGSYQLVNNSETPANRQGLRLSTTFIISGVETRLAYADYKQIQAADATSAFQSGFVEPYFTPQITAAGSTLGRERRMTGSFMWHPRFADVSLDLSDSTLLRSPTAGNLGEAVSMNYPSAVLSLSRNFGPKVFGSAGVARFAVDGSFDGVGPKNADLVQNVIFAGAELRKDATSAYHFQWRLYSNHGIPTVTPGALPDYHGSQLIFEQRFKT